MRFRFTATVLIGLVRGLNLHASDFTSPTVSVQLADCVRDHEKTFIEAFGAKGMAGWGLRLVDFCAHLEMTDDARIWLAERAQALQGIEDQVRPFVRAASDEEMRLKMRAVDEIRGNRDNEGQIWIQYFTDIDTFVNEMDIPEMDGFGPKFKAVIIQALDRKSKDVLMDVCWRSPEVQTQFVARIVNLQPAAQYVKDTCVIDETQERFYQELRTVELQAAPSVAKVLAHFDRLEEVACEKIGAHPDQVMMIRDTQFHAGNEFLAFSQFPRNSFERPIRRALYNQLRTMTREEGLERTDRFKGRGYRIDRLIQSVFNNVSGGESLASTHEEGMMAEARAAFAHIV